MQLKWKMKVSLISYFTIGLLSPCHQFCLAKYHALLHTYMHAYLHVCMSYTCRERVLYPSSSHDYFKLSQRHYIKQGTFSTYKNQAILVTRAPVNICVHSRQHLLLLFTMGPFHPLSTMARWLRC